MKLGEQRESGVAVEFGRAEAGASDGGWLGSAGWWAVEYEPAPRHLTIVECRAPWRDDDPGWTRFTIARLRYTKASRTWELYWRDRNLRFHAYDRVGPSASIDELLTEIDMDPTGIFWG